MISPSVRLTETFPKDSPLWYTVPSERKTQLSVSFPSGTPFKLLFLVAKPIPQIPVQQYKSQYQYNDVNRIEMLGDCM